MRGTRGPSLATARPAMHRQTAAASRAASLALSRGSDGPLGPATAPVVTSAFAIGPVPDGQPLRHASTGQVAPPLLYRTNRRILRLLDPCGAVDLRRCCWRGKATATPESPREQSSRHAPTPRTLGCWRTQEPTHWSARRRLPPQSGRPADRGRRLHQGHRRRQAALTETAPSTRKRSRGRLQSDSHLPMQMSPADAGGRLLVGGEAGVWPRLRRLLPPLAH